MRRSTIILQRKSYSRNQFSITYFRMRNTILVSALVAAVRFPGLCFADYTIQDWESSQLDTGGGAVAGQDFSKYMSKPLVFHLLIKAAPAP